MNSEVEGEGERVLGVETVAVREWPASPEGNEIRRLRIKADLTQQRLAELINRNKSYVGLIENGHCRPPLLIIRAISRVLKLSLAQEERLVAMRGQEYKCRPRYTASDLPVVTMKEGGASDET
jgi:transcriptional regulator with XRE-family HTH domain